ncbi:MAG: hypothetical protein WBA74_18105 [Cyclobacteriaceae bacterium]
MTKYDIRIRRESFSKGRIERHKDFKKFSGMYEEKRSKSSLTRLLLIIITLVILLTAVYFGYFKVKNRENETDQEKATSAWILKDANHHLFIS